MIGVDVVQIARMEKSYAKPHFQHSIFTEAERCYIEHSPHPIAAAAGIYAAKEAFAKALGVGMYPHLFSDVEVMHANNGRPALQAKGVFGDMLAKENKTAMLSITHDAGVAVAVCVLENKSKVQMLPAPFVQAKDLIYHQELALSLLRRDHRGYKTQYGKVALVGGSRGMAGSICLAAYAALRSGAGLVYVVVPDSLVPIVQNKMLEGIVKGVSDEGTGHFTQASLPDILAAINDCTSVAIGPGMGRFPDASNLIATLLQEQKAPFVLDADALNAIAKQTAALRTASQEIVLTPHEMEMSRLIGLSVKQVQEARDTVASRFAKDYASYVVLKGDHTVITDGNSLHHNPSGTPGMATAGAGDVLTGMMAAFLGYGYPTMTAARLACDFHGIAGEFAAADKGEESMIASDIVAHIPNAFRWFEALRAEGEKGEEHAESDARGSLFCRS